MGLHTRISPSHNTRGRWSLSGVARETTPGSGVEFATKIAQRAHRKAGAAEDGEPGRVTVGADLCGDDAPTVPSNRNSSRRAAISCARTAATGYARAWTPLDLNVPVLCLGSANTDPAPEVEGSARAHLLHSPELLLGRRLRHRPAAAPHCAVASLRSSARSLSSRPRDLPAAPEPRVRARPQACLARLLAVAREFQFVASRPFPTDDTIISIS